MKKWKYLKGNESHFDGNEGAAMIVKSAASGNLFGLGDGYLAKDIELAGDTVIAHRELMDDEQDLNDCIGATEGNADELYTPMLKVAADKSSAKMQDFLLNSSKLPMHKCMPNPLLSTESLIAERGSRYGKFKDGADIMQSLKDVMREVDGWNDLSPSQKEALDMIQHKIGRILNGDPNYDDSWKDIAGYATLIVNELNGEIK